MARLRAVSLDVFGTLIDITEEKDRPEAYAGLARWLGYHGIALDGAALQEEVTQRTAAALAANPEPCPDVDISDILRASIQARAPGPVDQVDLLLPGAALVLRTLTTVAVSAVPGARDAVVLLKEHYRLGICSNTQRAYTIGELRMFDMLGLFEHIVFSSDVRAGKPNAIMFRTLLEKFGESARDVVHIGDNLHDDIAGGAAAGLQTVWLQRSSDEQLTSAARPDRILPRSAIADLPQIIASIRAHD